MVDGSSRLRAFFTVSLPLVAPGLVATGIFAFIQAWNEFTFALVIHGPTRQGDPPRVASCPGASPPLCATSIPPSRRRGSPRATSGRWRPLVLAAADRPLVVVVRDPGRRAAQAAALRTLVAARPDAVVVDLGWPTGPGARPSAATRITTHGASRASGEAAARLLAGAGARDAAAPVPALSAPSPGGTDRG